MSTKRINQNEKEVINDAIRLGKDDFVSLYTKELEYEEQNASNAWHLIRASKKGQNLAKELKLKMKETPKSEIAEIKKAEVSETKVKQEIVTNLVVGSDIKFVTRQKQEVVGKVIKVLIGSDNKEYVKIKLPDGKIALKRTNALA